MAMEFLLIATTFVYGQHSKCADLLNSYSSFMNKEEKTGKTIVEESKSESKDGYIIEEE
ncbi:MAG: hypothetical protein IKM28_02660 [Lachnospiraceae bacterium]|nr:hypothetical protein [Lachnospiraceae bacterium]